MDIKTGQIRIENEGGISVRTKEKYQSSFELAAQVYVCSEEMADVDRKLTQQHRQVSALSERFGLGKVAEVTKESFSALRQKFQKDSIDAELNPADQKIAKDMLDKLNIMETEFFANQERKKALLVTLTALEKAKTTHA